MQQEELELPLFPLNSVLFPTSRLPLRIFEERYKTMLRDCMSADNSFGVVLIRSGNEVGGGAEPFNIGTIAKISEVREVEGGQFSVMTMGERRFSTVEITQQRPYIRARVNLLPREEDEAELAPDTIETVRAAVVDYVRAIIGLRGGWVREIKVPEDPVTLSYFAGDTLQIGLVEKQKLLEESSVVKRLDQELLMLHKETEELRQRLIGGTFRNRYSPN